VGIGRSRSALFAPAVGASALTIPVALFGLHRFSASDFTVRNLPMVNALRDGHVGQFLDRATVDSGSYILRAPVVLLPNLWGGGSLALYRVLALPCLLAVLWLAVSLWSRGVRAGATRAAAWGALALCVLNPFLLNALLKSHPEDILGGVVCIAAAFAARAQRPGWAGILLGLAIANKPWAVVATVPVLWLLDRGRVRTLLLAAIPVVVVLLPLVIRNATAEHSQALQNATSFVQPSGTLAFKPWQVWWFFGDPHHLIGAVFGTSHPRYRAAPEWVLRTTHPLAALVPAAVCLLLLPRLRRERWEDGLLLLALALLLRCMLDAFNIDYYEVPFTLALLSWEILARRSVGISLAVILTGWIVMTVLPFNISPDAQAVAYMAWSIPVAGWMLLRLMSVRGLEPLAPRGRPLGRAALAHAVQHDQPGELDRAEQRDQHERAGLQRGEVLEGDEGGEGVGGAAHGGRTWGWRVSR
jgi:hypothetical protein